MELDDLFDFGIDLNMLYGRFDHSLDSKGRVIIPARFRSCLGEVVFVTMGFETKCLNIFSVEEFKKRIASLRGIPASDAAGQKFIRYFVGNAEPCQVDKQGKILIPAHLREAAQLDKEVTLSGQMDRVEIWNRELWNVTSGYETTEELTASVEKYGF